MTLSEVVRNLEARGIMPDRVPSLKPMEEALKRLELRWPSDLRRIIVVAGTNGKGSTCKALETLLLRAGRRVGLYTSPHLIDIRERIRVAGTEATEAVFVEAFQAVDEACRDLCLSHFETLTAMAAWIFFSGLASEPVDDAIFEVGLGGTWDATNAIPHRTCVIAKLGLDHIELLGNTPTEIARNKLGIVTAGSVVVHLPFSPEARDVQASIRALKPSEWRETPAFSCVVEQSDRIPRWYLKSAWGEAEISLPGTRGAENINLALAAFASLGFDPSEYLADLKGIQWPARMQKLPLPAFSCPVFVSGDHNPQGVESLAELLRFYRYERLLLLVAVGLKKDRDEMMHAFHRLPRARVWLTTAGFQGRTREQYGSWVDRSEGFSERPFEALDCIRSVATAGDLVVITGSLYLAGDILSDGSRWREAAPQLSLQWPSPSLLPLSLPATY